MSYVTNLFQTYKKWIVMGVAIVLPFFAILIYPAYFHPDDMQDFLRWSKAWELNWRNIYLECNICTYPFLGTFFSGGIISLFDFEKTRHIVRVFHVYLAIIDALNIIAIYFILKELDVENSPFWAGLIGLLPSSWIGTSYWGQIDGIGQLIIFILIFHSIMFNKKAELNNIKYGVYLIISGILLACLLLTKQLVLFSLVCLGAMIFTNIFLFSRGLRSFLISLSIFGISFFLPIVFVDLILLRMPVSYASHIQYTFEVGSRIGNVISYFGFNVWVLFYKDTLVSSHTPLFNLGGLAVSPFLIGIFLFLLINFIFLFFVFGYFYPLYKDGVRFFRKSDILLWLFQISFLNLSFNLFLTGTHERYLYHFYPFIIIAFLGNLRARFKELVILVVGALIYGAFLYGYLSDLNTLFGRSPFYVMATFHFVLFVYLAVIANKYFFHHNMPVVS